jgi:hypothetical protein
MEDGGWRMNCDAMSCGQHDCCSVHYLPHKRIFQYILNLSDSYSRRHTHTAPFASSTTVIVEGILESTVAGVILLVPLSSPLVQHWWCRLIVGRFSSYCTMKQRSPAAATS